jgi:hypothetical protein
MPPFPLAREGLCDYTHGMYLKLIRRMTARLSFIIGLLNRSFSYLFAAAGEKQQRQL